MSAFAYYMVRKHFVEILSEMNNIVYTPGHKWRNPDCLCDLFCNLTLTVFKIEDLSTICEDDRYFFSSIIRHVRCNIDDISGGIAEGVIADKDILEKMALDIILLRNMLTVIDHRNYEAN